jgi:hypothetical protein
LLENFGRFNYALYKEKEMADFRRFMMVLAAVALLLGTVSTVSAQAPPALSCNASAVPTQSRQQGETELMGDVLLQCTGGTPTGAGLPDPLVNVQVFLNGTNVTSRILSTSGATSGATEALLIVDDGTVPPNIAAQFCPQSPCDNVGGGSIATSPYNGATIAGNKSVFYGTWNVNQPNSITFAGIPIDPPGTAGGTRTIRITNIRGNMSPFLPGAQITEFVSVSGSNPSVPINNPTQIVSQVQNGIVVSNSGLTSFSQCTSVAVVSGKISIAAGDVGNAGYITVQKGFANAFKVRNSAVTTAAGVGPGNIAAVPVDQNTPGNFNVNTETGFYTQEFPAPFNVAGLADTGTRIAVLFQNVPSGAHVYVPLLLSHLSPDIIGTNPALQYADPATGSLAGVLVSGETGTTVITAAASVDNTGNGVYALSEVALTSGAGEVVYEVSNGNPGTIEQFNIPITVAYIANPGAGTPAFGTATVGASFAPRIADILAETSSVAIPRFIDSSVQKNIFSIVACSTTLLYPFVTNQAGYDTGIAVSNTSMDPFGTSTQTGACALTMFGVTPGGQATSVVYNTTSDTTLTNGLVPPGTAWANIASIMWPTYQGYVIAVCNFQYAHGFAFILDPSLHVAQGYLALIIPGVQRANGASPFPGAGGGSGEQLGF